MTNKSLLTFSILFLSISLLAFPISAQEELDLPLRANIGAVFELAGSFALSVEEKATKNEAVSALVQSAKLGMYELEDKGELSGESVEEMKEELFRNLTSFQAGYLSPEEFAENMKKLGGRIQEEAENPVVTVTAETSLGQAIKAQPEVVKKAPSELDEKQVSALVKEVASRQGVKSKSAENGERAVTSSSEGGNTSSASGASSSSSETATSSSSGAAAEGSTSSSSGGESSGGSNESEPGLTQGKWKDPGQNAIREDDEEKSK